MTNAMMNMLTELTTSPEAPRSKIISERLDAAFYAYLYNRAGTMDSHLKEVIDIYESMPIGQPLRATDLYKMHGEERSYQFYAAYLNKFVCMGIVKRDDITEGTITVEYKGRCNGCRASKNACLFCSLERPMVKKEVPKTTVYYTRII